MPDLSFSSPLKQATPPKQKEGKKLSSDYEPQRKSADLPPSPALLPLPLCEDAVRNLNLCSKYSPTRASTSQNNSCMYTLYFFKITAILNLFLFQVSVFF